MSTRRFYTLSYVFFLIIVIGAFASIAQNRYGLWLLAGGCFGFSLLFLLRIEGVADLLDTFFPKQLLRLELIGMAAITMLFGFRALTVRFPFVEEIFVLISVMMAFINVLYGRKVYQEYKSSRRMSIASILLSIALILFFASMSTTFLGSDLSVAFGAASFACLALFFIIFVLIKKDAIHKENKISVAGSLLGQHNQAPIVVAMLTLIGLYMGLNMAKIVPPLYAGEIPIKYIELLQLSQEDEDAAKTGDQFKYEVFWDEYQEFLKVMEERK